MAGNSPSKTHVGSVNPIPLAAPTTRTTTCEICKRPRAFCSETVSSGCTIDLSKKSVRRSGVHPIEPYGAQLHSAVLTSTMTAFIPCSSRTYLGMRGVSPLFAQLVDPDAHPLWVGSYRPHAFHPACPFTQNEFLGRWTVTDFDTQHPAFAALFFQGTSLDLSKFLSVQSLTENFLTGRQRRGARCDGLRLPQSLRKVGKGFLSGASFNAALDLSSLINVVELGDEFMCDTSAVLSLKLPHSIEIIGKCFLQRALFLTCEIDLSALVGWKEIEPRFMNGVLGITTVRLPSSICFIKGLKDEKKLAFLSGTSFRVPVDLRGLVNLDEDTRAFLSQFPKMFRSS